MRKGGVLIVIGIISGVILAVFLKLIEILTDNRAYYLLFDVDYIPLLNQMDPAPVVEIFFHFGTCIISVTLLYYLLTFIHLEKSITAYAVIIGIGSAMLYLLTALSDKTPSVTDFSAWFYWVVGHLLFSLTTGLLARRWL